MEQEANPGLKEANPVLIEELIFFPTQSSSEVKETDCGCVCVGGPCSCNAGGSCMCPPP